MEKGGKNEKELLPLKVNSFTLSSKIGTNEWTIGIENQIVKVVLCLHTGGSGTHFNQIRVARSDSGAG